MKKGRFTRDQTIRILHKADAEPVPKAARFSVSLIATMTDCIIQAWADREKTNPGLAQVRKVLSL
jgi:hypothetical protein